MIYREIMQNLDLGRACVVVTVVEKEGHGPGLPGAKMLVLPDGKTIGTVGGGSLEKLAIQHSRSLLKSAESELVTYNLTDSGELNKDEVPTGMICGGKTTLFYEYIAGGENLYIFGAGHIGRIVVEFAQNLDYNVHLIDIRKDVLSEVIAQNAYLADNYIDFFQKENITPKSYFVVVTHSHDLDYQILKDICKTVYEPKYIGVIASQQKAALMLNQLCEDMDNPDISKLYMPIGLRIGGNKPAEIALSIIAEIQAVRHNQDNQIHMCKRQNKRK